MMEKIIESVPNISEGRNKETIEACVDTGLKDKQQLRDVSFSIIPQIRITTDRS